jgi:hypothetical protein
LVLVPVGQEVKQARLARPAKRLPPTLQVGVVEREPAQTASEAGIVSAVGTIVGTRLASRQGLEARQ